MGSGSALNLYSLLDPDLHSLEMLDPDSNSQPTHHTKTKQCSDFSSLILSETLNWSCSRYCDIDALVLAVKPVLNARGEPETPAMIQIDTR